MQPASESGAGYWKVTATREITQVRLRLTLAQAFSKADPPTERAAAAQGQTFKKAKDPAALSIAHRQVESRVGRCFVA